MLVLLISECGGKAWQRTRRIADLYLERVGERSWRGRLTGEGLRRLRDDLALVASRHTAVACHRVATRQRFELEWIVGSAAPFGDDGQVATYRGHRYDAYLDERPEPPPRWAWLTNHVRCAALLHDLGKANAAFQAKLRAGRVEADPVRHEVLSMLTYVGLPERGGSATAALAALLGQPLSVPEEVRLDGGRLTERALVSWLVATHHRLLTSRPLPDRWVGGAPMLLTYHLNPDRPWQAEPGSVTLDPDLLDDELRARLAALVLPGDTALAAPLWEAAAAYGRLALLLADQGVSRAELDRARHPNGPPAKSELLANTERGQPKQALVEHLTKVAEDAVLCMSDLHDAPRLAPSLDARGLPRPFRQRAAGRFAWQNTVCDAVAARPPGGFFGVLVAETGSGKTQATAKVMAALRDRVRYTVGLPLRTLTTQTGAEYREQLGLSEADLAVVLGGSAAEAPTFGAGNPGMGSEVWSDEEQPEVDGGSGRWAELAEAVKRHLAGSPKALHILAAPILVTTIDHLMPAADQRRTGFLVAALRLLTADLVLDEVDVFSERDLVAVGRLVHLAGLFGRNVLLASATLPPSVARSLWRSWRAGCTCHAALHGLADEACGGVFSNLTAPLVVAGGFDALDASLQEVCAAITAELDVRPSPRRAAIMPREAACDLDSLFDMVTTAVASNHRHHARAVSIARQARTLSLQLVHFAHVDACVAYARKLERRPPEGIDTRYVVYHARHPLLVRAHIEAFLDRVLRRKDADRALLADPVIRGALLDARSGALAVVVIATSVEEVGRDHDFDAAVIEPSSSRGIVQLAGRVQRHRLHVPEVPNLLLLPTSIRRVRNPAVRYAYRRPGVEGPDLDGRDRSGVPLAGSIRAEAFTLPSPWLDEILDPQAWAASVTAAPRLRETSGERLVALEHERLRAFLEGPAFHALPLVWNGTMAWLSAAHPEVMRFRAGEPRTAAWLDPAARLFWQIEAGRGARDVGRLEVAWPAVPTAHALLDLDPEALLASYVKDEASDAATRTAARLLRVDLPVWSAAWQYHPQFGLFRELAGAPNDEELA